jgi:hypothetical protein
MNGTMKFTMSAELATEIARATAFEMVNASEGEFTSGEVARVLELAGDEFTPEMNSALIESAAYAEVSPELTSELAHAFTVACGARGESSANFVEVSVELAEFLTEFVAVMADGDGGAPLF